MHVHSRVLLFNFVLLEKNAQEPAANAGQMQTTPASRKRGCEHINGKEGKSIYNSNWLKVCYSK